MTAGYGSQPVIHSLSLEVAAGEIVALLGANGAGKTTTLLALSGELPLMEGEVLFDGVRETRPLYRRARRGLAYVTEERSVFKGLSLIDNLRCGGVRADDVLALFPELERRMQVRGGLLSGGEQQMLTLGRALARKPRLLLADELSLGLAPAGRPAPPQRRPGGGRPGRLRGSARGAARAQGPRVRRPRVCAGAGPAPAGRLGGRGPGQDHRDRTDVPF